MTAQAGDVLLFNGETLNMFANPLEDYFERVGERPAFQRRATHCLRGYIASWEVIDDCLLLVELDGYLKDGRPLSVATFFPETSDRAFADWFSDTVRIPQGRMIKGENFGYASIFECDLLITFSSGVLKEVTLQHNSVSTEPTLVTVSKARLPWWRRILPRSVQRSL